MQKKFYQLKMLNSIKEICFNMVTHLEGDLIDQLSYFRPILGAATELFGMIRLEGKEFYVMDLFEYHRAKE